MGRLRKRADRSLADLYAIDIYPGSNYYYVGGRCYFCGILVKKNSAWWDAFVVGRDPRVVAYICNACGKRQGLLW